MVFKTTFNNISVISWQSVLLMEETYVQTLKEAAVYWYPMSILSSVDVVKQKGQIVALVGTDDGYLIKETTFNNISVISWQSVLLMEKSGVPGENNQPVASH
jgi:hypothetical protein